MIGMTAMTADLTDRLAEAAGVPVLLAVAYDAFEHMLRALRECREPGRASSARDRHGCGGGR